MAKPKDSVTNKDQPWVANYPPLKEWLTKHKAFCQWQLPMLYGERPNAYVECWQVGDRQVVLIVHWKQQGWNIFTDSQDSTIAATLLDVERRLGIT